ncbi:hypothetical protein LPB142_07860 [Rhodobacter xanthinilyticus]|uniref:Uncharacterized protein n=1 Tax=Rhodobacter xanthinilyticus TaxID=1850250 RepID=A0A1D9MBH5_9RHOB|nr:hypothetical protein [Rhodobacter xanthinilyticus]AOZ69245.1 hypothetical protein LPB142_07860 [Rhodobacter xanthinilyticus]
MFVIRFLLSFVTVFLAGVGVYVIDTPAQAQRDLARGLAGLGGAAMGARPLETLAAAGAGAAPLLGGAGEVSEEAAPVLNAERFAPTPAPERAVSQAKFLRPPS